MTRPRLARGIAAPGLALVLAGAAAGQRPAPPVPVPPYQFVLDTDRFVGFTRDGVVHVGKLSAKGEFELVRKITPPRDEGLGVLLLGPQNDYDRLLVPPDGKYPYTAYELRSGMLIPGLVTSAGYFIPQNGGRVIPFGDYRYSPDAPPVWNLPGRYESLRKMPPPAPLPGR